MKRIILSLSLVLTVVLANCQAPVRETSPESFTNKMQRLMVEKNFTLPRVDTKPTVRPSLLNGGSDSLGTRIYVREDSSVYTYVGGDTWIGSASQQWVSDRYPLTNILAAVAFSGSFNDLTDVPPATIFLTPGGGLTGLNTFIQGIRVDSSLFTTVNETRRLIDSIAVSNGGGISEVSVGYGIHGKGTIAEPVYADTLSANSLVTRSYLQEALASLDLGSGGGSTYSLVNSATATISGDGTTTPWQVNVIGAAGTNPMQAISLLDYGGVPDAVVGSLDVTGTNNVAALNAAIAAAADNQPIIIPAGEWLFDGVQDTIKSSKRLNLIVYGNTYHRGHDWIIIANSGPFETHTFRHYGRAYGQVPTAMPSHTKSRFDNGTGPDWSSFTGVLVKIYNAYEQHIEMNFTTGFDAPIEIIGETKPGQLASGSQENDVWLGWSYKNANGIKLTSLNGQSYCDKNNFWFRRISGGMGIRIDGYAGVSWADGETYNGAFRSNHFFGLIEQVDSIMFAYGDITEPEFNITIEGGVNTGVYEPGCAINIGMTGPNVMRGPRWNGQGVMSHRHMVNGMGYNGIFSMPVYQDNNYIGNFAVIDEEGYLVFHVSSDFFNTYRLNAPANFKFVTFGDREDAVTVSSATYTVPRGIKFIYYTGSGGTITLPTPWTSVQRDIYITNEHATSSVTVANVKTGYITSIPPGVNMWYRSEGSFWRSMMSLPGTGGGSGTGSSNWVDLTGGNVATAGKVRIGSSSLQPTAKLHISAPSGNANEGSLKLDAGPMVAVAEKGLFQHFTDGSLWFTGNDGITRKFAFNYGHNYQAHVVTTTSTYTPGSEIGVIICNSASGAANITLPDPTLYPGREIRVQNLATGTTVSVNNADPNVNCNLPDEECGIVLFSDGTSWRVINKWKKFVAL